MSEQTVMTPKALARSFQSCKLSEMQKIDADAFYHFIFPSPSILNELNGDGDLLGIFDVTKDCTAITTVRGDFQTNPNTIVYYPCPPKTLRVVIQQGSGTLYRLWCRDSENVRIDMPSPLLNSFCATLIEKWAGKMDSIVLVRRVFAGLREREQELFDTFTNEMTKCLSEQFKVSTETVPLLGFE